MPKARRSRERALALEWTLLGSRARPDDRRRVAEAYVQRFPQGSRAETIRAWIAAQD